jgi:hypothetical protein
VAGASDKPMVEVLAGTEKKSFAPEEVSAMVSDTDVETKISNYHL